MNIKKVVINAGWSAVLLVLGLTVVQAQQPLNSPVGLWKNVDDVTGKSLALIRISESNGILSGKIEKLFLAPGENPHPTCIQCEGVNKDQPVLGMMILVGLSKAGDEYRGGTILDPDNGQQYKSRLRLEDGGKKLEVRGYIGISWLGRSQIWLRE